MPSIDRRVLGAGVVIISCAMATPAAQRFALPDPVRAAADAITPTQLAWDVARLASDEWGGRNTPSPGFDAAATYITERLARAGVEPIGDSGGYRQHYDLIESRVDTAGAADRNRRDGAALRRRLSDADVRRPAGRHAAGGLRRARVGDPVTRDRPVCGSRRARQAGAGARPSCPARRGDGDADWPRDRGCAAAAGRSGAPGRGRRALHHRSAAS